MDVDTVGDRFTLVRQMVPDGANQVRVAAGHGNRTDAHRTVMGPPLGLLARWRGLVVQHHGLGLVFRRMAAL